MSDPSKWTHPMVPTRRHGPPSVIHAGLMRTGTLSMARAYDILHLRSHHGLDMLTGPSPALGGKQWSLLELAAEGTWPSVPGARLPAPRFTRDDWDELYGDYDVATDVASYFVDQLIECYPDAKVVIVERGFDKWWASFETQVMDGLFNPFLGPLMGFLAWMTGLRAGLAMQKMLLGFFGAKDVGGIKKNAKAVHKAYYKKVRELVPKERRLEYTLGDGWEPLCKFLGKDIPDGIEFPNINDKVEHRARQMQEGKLVLGMLWDSMRLWVLAALSILATIVAIWIVKA